MSTARRRLGWGVPVGAAVLMCLAGCTSSTSNAGSDPTDLDSRQGRPPAVLFGFEDMDDSASPETANEGWLQGEATSMVVNGGELGPQPGPDGQSVRFPAFDASSDPARAVLVYRAAAGELDPGEQDFRFGADFVLDDVTQGGEDDGNNLVQRGLSADPVQFKIQADNDMVSCRLAGDLGSVTVSSPVKLEPQVWYRVICSRQGTEVVLDLQTATGRDIDTVRQEARLGSLEFDSSVPLVMGGKVGADGAVVRSKADQLNGALDNVVVHVG